MIQAIVASLFNASKRHWIASLFSEQSSAWICRSSIRALPKTKLIYRIEATVDFTVSPILCDTLCSCPYPPFLWFYNSCSLRLWANKRRELMFCSHFALLSYRLSFILLPFRYSHYASFCFACTISDILCVYQKFTFEFFDFFNTNIFLIISHLFNGKFNKENSPPGRWL